MVAAAVIGGVATIGSAVVNSSAASSAANTAAQTADKNNALQSQIYDSNKATLSPYDDGGASTAAINGLLGTGGDAAASAKAYSDWQNSTGYQQALKTGMQSVTAALGQKGLTDSGAGDKALLQFGQNFANQNEQTYIGNLQTQQQTGLGAASALAGVGTNYANSVSANNNTAAEASENAALSSANSISSALSNLTQSAALGSSYANRTGALTGSGYSLSSANSGLGALY